MNTGAHVFFQIGVFVFSRCMPRNGIAGSYGSSTLRSRHAVLHSDCNLPTFWLDYLVFLILSCVNCLYILEIEPLLITLFANMLFFHLVYAEINPFLPPRYFAQGKNAIFRIMHSCKVQCAFEGLDRTYINSWWWLPKAEGAEWGKWKKIKEESFPFHSILIYV